MSIKSGFIKSKLEKVIEVKRKLHFPAWSQHCYKIMLMLFWSKTSRKLLYRSSFATELCNSRMRTFFLIYNFNQNMSKDFQVSFSFDWCEIIAITISKKNKTDQSYNEFNENSGIVRLGLGFWKCSSNSNLKTWSKTKISHTPNSGHYYVILGVGAARI